MPDRRRALAAGAVTLGASVAALRAGPLAAQTAAGSGAPPARQAETSGGRSPESHPAEIPAALRQLAQSLAQRGPRRTRFVERRHSSLLRVPLESRGTLAFEPPDRLERVVTAPRRETVTIHGTRLTIEPADGAPRTVRVDTHPALAAFADSLRATLAGDLVALQQHFSIAMQGTPAAWTLTLLPFDAAVKAVVERIRLRGRSGDVTRVDVFEPGGDRTELLLGDGA